MIRSQVILKSAFFVVLFFFVAIPFLSASPCPSGDYFFNLLTENPNVFLVLNGHYFDKDAGNGEANLTENNITMLLADYQSYDDGGLGFMRLMKFIPSENRIFVQTFSPYQGYENDSNSEFSIDYNMTDMTENFTLVVLPDTQLYSYKHPQYFTRQTQWIIDNKESLNIIFVAHEGDIVENHEREEEWQNANTSMSILDGIVPYSLVVGNHDMDINSKEANNFLKYFPVSRYSEEQWFGGSDESGLNRYYFFNSSNMDFIIFSIEFCPSQETLLWINETLKTYPEKRAIITAHNFLKPDSTRYSADECPCSEEKKDNGGGSSGGGGSGGSSHVIDCIPDWQCSEWSDCLAQHQNRVCQDINTCDKWNSSYKEYQNCTIILPPQEQEENKASGQEQESGEAGITGFAVSNQGAGKTNKLVIFSIIGFVLVLIASIMIWRKNKQ